MERIITGKLDEYGFIRINGNIINQNNSDYKFERIEVVIDTGSTINAIKKSAAKELKCNVSHIVETSSLLQPNVNNCECYVLNIELDIYNEESSFLVTGIEFAEMNQNFPAGYYPKEIIVHDTVFVYKNTKLSKQKLHEEINELIGNATPDNPITKEKQAKILHDIVNNQ